MNLWVAHVIEEYDRSDWHRSIFGDVSGFIKRELDNLETVKVNELTKFGCARLGAEASKAVNVLVTVATVALAGDMMQHKNVVWELVIQS